MQPRFVSMCRTCVKVIFKALLAGSIVFMVANAMRTNPVVEQPAAKKVSERLFDEVDLGGALPSPEVRTRIADFARANEVDIRFEICSAIATAS